MSWRVNVEQNAAAIIVATLHELLYTTFHEVFPMFWGFERLDNYFIILDCKHVPGYEISQNNPALMLTKSNKCVQYNLVHWSNWFTQTAAHSFEQNV